MSEHPPERADFRSDREEAETIEDRSAALPLERGVLEPGVTEESSVVSRRPRRRIAQKLILLYFLPVSILIIAGVGLPLLQWGFFGATIRDYEAAARFAEQVEGLRKAAGDSENLYRAFLAAREPTRVNARRQLQETRQEYRVRYNQVDDYIETRNNDTLRALFRRADLRFQRWSREFVDAEFFRRPFQAPSRRLGTRPEDVALEGRAAFVAVERDFTEFVRAAQSLRDLREADAHTAALLRQLSAILFPFGAFVLAALIGRSIALGITRPLEELTLATEELERGTSIALLSEEANRPLSDDEVGVLQQSFIRMARTIGQREAMLRAQNETLGALKQRIESVLNATNDAILMFDRAGAFSVVNQRFSELFDIEAEVLLDQTFAQAAPLFMSRFRKRHEVRDRLERLLADPQAVTEENVEVAEPTPRVLRLFSAPVRGERDIDGEREILGRIVVFRDVTREMMVDRMKTDFVSTVSHELRTPLTAIKGYVDLMVTGQTGALNSTQTEFLTMVQSSTKRLTSLINDLLDISKIESERIDIKQESVAYLPLVREAVRMMQGEAESKSIRLSVETKGDTEGIPPVLGDGDRITQVLVNFLSNGIKYTPDGGRVTVVVEYADGLMTTCVEDTGIGIDPADQNRLFQKFFRADNSTTRETGGTGLGLAITKAILEKLGGSVWVESQSGKGSKFWFTLPTVDSELAPESTAMHRLVLNIDGDTPLLHRLGHELRLQGFVTSNAATPAEAIRRARGLRPDIITLNPFAPNLNGIEVLETLRQSPVTAGIPVAFLTIHRNINRLDATDNLRYVPVSISDADLARHIRDSLVPMRSRREVVLVAGTAETIDRVRKALIGRGSGILILTATTTEEAIARITENYPDLAVLDTTERGISIGQIGQRLQERRSLESVPIIVLMETELLAGAIAFLPEAGSGTVPLSRLGVLLRRLLTGKPFTPTEPSSTPAETAERTEVTTVGPVASQAERI
ncbi:MAG: ATP-binding protein [Capsulimonadales bacterium]|nr:ATP-binding protein [Capsulimonadales bacterium]